MEQQTGNIMDVETICKDVLNDIGLRQLYEECILLRKIPWKLVNDIETVKAVYTGCLQRVLEVINEDREIKLALKVSSKRCWNTGKVYYRIKLMDHQQQCIIMQAPIGIYLADILPGRVVVYTGIQRDRLFELGLEICSVLRLPYECKQPWYTRDTKASMKENDHVHTVLQYSRWEPPALACIPEVVNNTKTCENKVITTTMG